MGFERNINLYGDTGGLLGLGLGTINISLLLVEVKVDTK